MDALIAVVAFAAGIAALIAAGVGHGIAAVAAWAIGFVFAILAHRAQKRALFEAQLLAAIRQNRQSGP